MKQGERCEKGRESGETEKRRNLFREFLMTFRGISVTGCPTSTLLLFFNHKNRKSPYTLHISQRAIFPEIKVFWVFLGFFFVLFCFVFFCFLHLRHTEVPRLGVKLDYSCWPQHTATATPDPTHICDLHHSSRQCRILNPLSEARN